MAKKTPSTGTESLPALFPLEDFKSAKPPSPASIEGNVWTRHKAQLIARYLYSFLSVTRNGIYIDAFAGPQTVEDRQESWAALRLLEKKSIFLNRAYLFEQDQSKIQFLNELRAKYCQGFTRLWRRQILVYPGDCNQEIPKCLQKYRIKPRKAAFALLDQRTHECTWELVKTLATHKTEGTKIEIFYFLAQGWMNRSIKSSTTAEKLREIDAWWGGSDWPSFVDKTSYERSQLMEERFKDELGYKFARAFPMRDKGHEGRIMFWLIHASDHPRATPLMISAYRSIALHWSDERWEQAEIKSTQSANLGDFTVTRVRMADDLMQDGLIKKDKKAASFVTIGEPEIALHVKKGKATVEILGVDIYDPITDQVKSRDIADIAYWMLDPDYDGSNFFPRQIFFCGGDKDEYDDWKKGLSRLAADGTKKKVQRTLRIEIDDEAFDSLYGHESRPIEVKKGQKLAVRVISQFGEETTKILTVP